MEKKPRFPRIALYLAWLKENAQYLYALLILFGIPLALCFPIPVIGLVCIFWIASAALYITSLWLIIEGLGSIPHWRSIRKLHREASCDDLSKNVAAIISAYLSNEIHTIEDCIRAVASVDLPQGTKFRVVVSHNGGRPQQIQHLRNMIDKLELRENVTVEDHYVVTSTSKAENVNSAIEYLAETNPPEVVAMYDADHHPSKHSVIHALQTMKYRNADLVQGRCVVTRGSTNIAAEFDTIYAVNHAGGAFVRGFGIFGGSNGFWKFDLLRKIKMDESMLTEDVDSGFRVLESGANIQFDPTVTSMEESPSDLQGLIKQRVRWSQGWSQVGTRHLRLLANSKISLYRRFMIFLMLHWREVFYYLTPWILGSVIYSFVFDHRFAWYLFPVTGLLALQGPILTLLAAWHVQGETHPGLNWKTYLIYILISPLYEMLKNMICLIAHYRNAMGLTKWNVTARKKAATVPLFDLDTEAEEVKQLDPVYDQTLSPKSLTTRKFSDQGSMLRSGLTSSLPSYSTLLPLAPSMSDMSEHNLDALEKGQMHSEEEDVGEKKVATQPIIVLYKAVPCAKGQFKDIDIVPRYETLL